MNTKDIEELRAAAIGVTHIVGYQGSIPHGQAQTFARGVVALCDEVERLNGLLRELQAEIARLQERCARSGMEARRAERERLRGYFRDALADTGITWPGEVDILYDKCFGAPYVPDEAA